jgi:tripeptide aminopeptidase
VTTRQRSPLRLPWLRSWQADTSPRGAVAFTVGEEGLGNLRGATAACRALRSECAIALEGHWLDRTVVDAVGSLRARISVAGPGGHPWEDDVAASAVHAALGLGARLVKRRHGGRVNVGMLSGGRSVNTIADQADLLVEIRSTDEHSVAAFERTLGHLRVPSPLSVRVEIVGRRPAGRLRRNSRLLRQVRAARAELGLPEALGSGSSDANAALAQGIPGLALGVGRGLAMHTLEERIEIASLELGQRLLESVLLRFLDDGRGRGRNL